MAVAKKCTRASNNKVNGYYRALNEGSIEEDDREMYIDNEVFEVGVDECYEVERLIEKRKIKVSH